MRGPDPCTEYSTCLGQIAATVDAIVLVAIFVPITVLVSLTRYARWFRALAVVVGFIVAGGIIVAGLPLVRAPQATQKSRTTVR